MQLSDAAFYSANAPAGEIRNFTGVPALGRLSMDLLKSKADTEQIWRMLQVKFLP